MLRIVGGFVMTVLLLAAGFAVFVLDTAAGARWVASLAGEFSDGVLRIEGIEGSLSGTLRADALLVGSGGTRIRADEVVLDLHVSRLLRGQVVVAALRAARLVVVAPPASDAPSEPFRMPAITTPLPVRIGALDIGEIEWRGEPRVVVTGVHFAGSLAGSSLAVRELRGAVDGFAMRLAGTAGLLPELPLDVRVEWRAAGTALSGAGTIRGDLDALAIEQSLRVPQSVQVSATLKDPAGEPRLEAAADWKAVATTLAGVGEVTAREGHAELQGWIADWTATLGSRLEGPGFPALSLTARAHGDGERMVFDEARLAGAAGTLRATGDMTLAAGPRLQLALTASDVDTAAFRPGLSGRLSARATLDAQLPGEFQLQVLELRGQLMERPLTGTGRLGYTDGLLRFDGVRLQAGSNRLQADGTLGDELGGRFSLDADDLSTLWPGVSGQLTAQATLGGTLARPEVTLDARGGALVAGDAAVGQFNLRLQTDARQALDARVTATGIAVAGRQLGAFEAEVEGSLARHRVVATLGRGEVSASITSAGSWDGATLAHDVEAAGIAFDPLGEWQLAGTPRVRLRAGSVEVGAHCWAQAPASLCVDSLAWSEQRAGIKARLREFDLAPFAPWLPAGFALTGRANADADLGMDDGVLVGRAQWEQDGTQLIFTGGEGEMTVAFDTARASLEFAPQEAKAALAVVTGAGTRLDGDARMSTPLGAQAPLEARVSGRLPDIALLVPLLAGNLDLAEVAGEITLDVNVGGSLDAPQIGGNVQLAGGEAAFTETGVTLDRINVTVAGDGSNVLRLQGTAYAGAPLALEGEVQPLAAGGPAGVVRIRGERVDAVHLPNRHVQASPDLVLSFSQGAARIDGEVLIPKADVVVRELPKSAISPSPDTVVIGREQVAKQAPGAVIGGEIDVTFGNEVRLRGFGLDTRLEGSVKLSQAASGELQGFGVVRLVEGKIGSYGKELTIERGTLGFAGPIDDPLVDLRATRQVDWEGRRVTAGILVRGPATRSQTTVFSEPAMSEADALSFLIAGRPMQNTDSDQRSAISGAVFALGLQQASPLTERVGSAVTLDELGVQGSDVDQAEVVAGKQFGSDLYVRFTYGLFNQIGTVLARYRLSRSLSIEAASGEDQSLDLVWSVETE